MAVDVKTFATELARSLTARGIPKDLAIKHAVSLVRTFDEEDLREISSYTDPEEFSELSASLAELIKDKEMPDKKQEEKDPANKAEAPEEQTDEKVPKEEKGDSELDTTKAAPADFPRAAKPSSPANATEEFRLPGRANSIPLNVDSTVDATRRAPRVPEIGGNMKTRAFSLDGEAAGEPDGATKTFAGIKTGDISLKADGESGAFASPVPVKEELLPDGQEIYLNDDGTLPKEPTGGKAPLSGRGKAVFWGVLIGTLPITLVISVIVLGVFALGILTVCALMVASVALLCFEAVAGCGLTLVGVIYGAIEIISGHMGIGLYEMGLGIVIGGSAMLLSILTYNLAVAALPYILKQLLSFEGYCLRCVGPMIRRFREECGKL